MNHVRHHAGFVESSLAQRLALVLCLGGGLTACGPQAEDSAGLSSEGATTQSYQAWCQDWQLICPTVDPGKTEPASAAQFRAISSILNGALKSPSNLNLNRQDLAADGLKQSLTALRLDDVYQDLQVRLDASQWQSGGLENGALVAYNAIESTAKADSGLVLNLSTKQQVQIADQGLVNVLGISYGAEAAAQNAELQSLAVVDDGSFNVGLSDRSVTQVPSEFAVSPLLLAFGIDSSKLKDKTIAIGDVVAAGGPLIGWFNKAPRQVAFDRAFFVNAAGQLGTLLPEDEIGKNLGNLLNAFDKLRTSSDAKANLATINLLKGSNANCNINNGDVKLKFSTEFGLKRYYQVNATTLGLEFYGVSASAKKALGISINVKRVELTADKATILDVPLIGKVDVKFSDIIAPGQKLSLVCGA